MTITARFLGDSVTAGFNATNVGTNDWASLVCANQGWTQQNRAFSSAGIKEFGGLDTSAHGWGQPVVIGTAAGDLGTQAFFGAVTANSKTLAICGYNDGRYNGQDADALETNRRVLRACLAWRGRLTSDIKQGNDAGWTYTGSWSDLALPAAAATTELNTKYTTTSGDKGSISVSGTAITLAYLCYHDDSNTGATFTVKIDGVSVGGTVDTEYGKTTGNQYDTHYSVMAVRYSGLSAGSHTIEITATSSAFLVICFVAGAQESVQPACYLSGPLLMANYTGGIAAYNNGSDAAMTDYGNMVSALVTERVQDGGNASYVNVNAYYDKTADVDSDTIHPTDQGHQHIANAFLASINAAPAPTPLFSRTYWS